MEAQGTAYKWFWKHMDVLSQAKTLTPEAIKQYKQSQSLEKFRKIKKNIGTANEFLNDSRKLLNMLNGTGVDLKKATSFITKLSAPINLLNNVVGATSEAIEAAEEVSLQLSTWYHEAALRCRNESQGDDDIYYLCSAAIDRQWQVRNVKGVLGSQSDSFVMKLWPKWKDRILALI